MNQNQILLVVANGIGVESIGGTEAVADGLSVALSARGWHVHIAHHVAGEHGGASNELTTGGVSIHRLPPIPDPSRADTFALRSPTAPGFSDLLEQVRPAIVQLHGISVRGANLAHIAAAKAAGARVVVWHNVPGVTCLQKGLLYLGSDPCDGEIRVQRCTRCRLQAHAPQGYRLAPLGAWLLSNLDLSSVRRAIPKRLHGVLMARHHTDVFAKAWLELSEQVDVFRVGAHWAYDVLLRNGVPQSKLQLIRPGVGKGFLGAETNEAEQLWRTASNKQRLRIVYWGRIQWPKGVQTLLQAVLSLPECPLDLLVIGPWAGGDGRLDRLRVAAEADGRVQFTGPMEPKLLSGVLRTADVGVIPSRWHETGPLTVYEARAAGLPIIGARRGGIAEICDGDLSARLFEPEQSAELAGIITEIAGNRDLLSQMKSHVPQPRTMEQVCDDVEHLYTRLLSTA